MHRKELDAIRAQAKASANGPWATHLDAMCRKSVLRRLCKLLPMSIEAETQVAREEMVDAGIAPMDITDEVEIGAAPEPEQEEDGDGEAAA